jgi:glycerol-3-phosphate dehydrogenase
MESPRARPAVLGSKGVHIAVPRERLGNRSAITLLAPSDERVLFALPAGTHSIIGTTETPADAPPGEIRAHMSDVRYLLETANHYFPAAQLTEDDVISAWAGIRPLAMPTHGESAGSASREHALTWSDHGVLTVSGGKLTTYRPVAAQVVEAAAERIGRTVRHSITDEAPLPGGDITSLEAEVAAATEASGAADVGRHLASSHGSDWRIVWGVAAREATLAERIVPELPYLKAEIPYTVRHEMACTLGDILIRRTHIAFETRDHGVGVASAVARIAAGTAGWSEEDIAHQLANYRAEVARIFTIES